MNDEQPRYYVEHDGRVFLVRRDGTLDLPVREELPFPVREIAPLAPGDTRYCVPLIDRHPIDWHHKDHLDRVQATPRVREAVHATMPRVVVEGLCLRENRVLLVKGNRGLTNGIWTLPGGFLQFGETPEACVLREIHEEIGMQGQIQALAAVRSKLGRHSLLHWTMLFYRVRVEGTPRPNPDEIDDAEFVTHAEAIERLGDATMATVIGDLLTPTRTRDGRGRP